MLYSVRDYLPLQQGLRRLYFGLTKVYDFSVRDYLPLQQGLRPYLSSSLASKRQSPRLSSITTRIKTEANCNRRRLTRLRPRLSSITTRIKTLVAQAKAFVGIGVRDYLPLQQGLRHSSDFMGI